MPLILMQSVPALSRFFLAGRAPMGATRRVRFRFPYMIDDVRVRKFGKLL